MKTKKAEIKITPPKSVHIIAWSHPKYNYRIVAKNGETLISTSQGFEKLRGLINNIQAVALLFLPPRPKEGPVYAREVDIYWVDNQKSKTIISKGIVSV